MISKLKMEYLKYLASGGCLVIFKEKLKNGSKVFRLELLDWKGNTKIKGNWAIYHYFMSRDFIKHDYTYKGEQYYEITYPAKLLYRQLTRKK